MSGLNPTRLLWILGLLWLAVQAGLWITYGTFIELEAEKYTAAAKYLLQHGKFPERKYVFYAATPLLIALSLKLGTGYSGAVVLQLVFNGWAMRCFFRLCNDLSGNFHRAALATVALLLFLPFQSWNVYLYSESVFFSAIILLVYALYRFAENPTVARLAAAGVATLLVLIARPFGMLFIPGLMIFGFLLLPRRLRIVSVGFAAVGAVFFYYALNRAFSGSVDWNALRPNIAGSIICDIPDPRNQQPLHLLRGGNPVDQLAFYITHNTGHYLRLSALRLWAFLWPARPWYSNVHNIYVGAAAVFFYTCFFLGLPTVRNRAPRAFFGFLITALISYTAAVTLQCDDYHNRFWTALVPILILAASCIRVPSGWSRSFK